jgi:sugar lactone lactonase YvrE
MPTSCAFIGPNYEQMIITTAHDAKPDAKEDWGKTYICTPKIGGVAPTLFPN